MVYNTLFYCTVILCIVSSGLGQFVFPDIVLQAYTPKGFRVYVEDRPDIKLFVFEGKINEEIQANTSGDISADIVAPTDGKWSYFDQDLQLKIGDVIHYWVYIQSTTFGYSKFDQSWTVTSLISSSNEVQCGSTKTTASGTDRSLCGGNLIFEDDFRDGTINSSLWTVEQYIPLYSEHNFEFVSYRDINQCRFIRDSKLYLKPVIAGDAEVVGSLDLTNGCTRSTKEACVYQQLGANILPPIKSGKVVSKMAFKYGRIEIRAKLPVGDWIYPQIELIPKDQSKQYPKFLIAYSRGNERLTLANGDDLGSQLLFGGYAQSPEEPQRSELLRSIRQPSPIGKDMNVFTLIWTPNKIDVMLNNNIYGTIYKSLNLGEYRISLGVGVGGNVDFPDGVLSGSFRKPWTNNAPKQAKNFADQKATWASTWKSDDVALQVDYVRVYAV